MASAFNKSNLQRQGDCLIIVTYTSKPIVVDCCFEQVLFDQVSFDQLSLYPVVQF